MSLWILLIFDDKFWKSKVDEIWKLINFETNSKLMSLWTLSIFDENLSTNVNEIWIKNNKFLNW